MNETKPLVSKGLVATAGFLAPLLLAVSPLLPTIGSVALGPIAAILAFICAALAGLGLPQVNFGVHKPLVPLAAVPLLSAAVPVVMQFAAVTTGYLSVILQGVALVAAFLAGLAAPAPLKPSEEKAKEAAIKVLSE